MRYQRIQCLRCFAAIGVVLFHSFGTCQKYFSGSSRLVALAHGDYGVDLFFVISGFIIFLTANYRELGWRDFLKRRVERIVPLYWITSVCMFLMMSWLYRSTIDAPGLNYLFYSMFYLSWFIGKLPVIYPGWTLEYEMAFYLLVLDRHVPSVSNLAVRDRGHNPVACSLESLRSISASHLRALVFFTNPMYVEFALGVLVAHVIMARPLPLRWTIALAAVIAIIAFDPWDEPKWRLLVAGLPAALIGPLRCESMRDQRAKPLSFSNRLFARLGDASYSIYLMQVFVISIACKVLAAAVPRLPVDAAIVIVSLATLLVAYGVHLGVELPMTRWLHRRDRVFREPAAA